MDTRERKALIDSDFIELDITDQCNLLGLPRSTLYYRPVSASEQDLAAMRTLDELYQEDPARGTRRLSNELQKQGFDIGRAIDNVIVEGFFRTIKYDKLYLESLETGADVQRACHEFIQYYNHKRDHSSIGNQPPMVFTTSLLEP